VDQEVRAAAGANVGNADYGIAIVQKLAPEVEAALATLPRQAPPPPPTDAIPIEPPHAHHATTDEVSGVRVDALGASYGSATPRRTR
jgi:hypothetical protein